MKFDELDARMRAFETVRDSCAMPDVYLVTRLDGRGFTRLTKELLEFDKPFDVRFRDHMVATVEHLMTCGFSPLFGYAQSDEISLLFGRENGTFGRNVRKWTSVLAAEASAAFSVRLGQAAAFDCRVIELPGDSDVVDYFRWRNEDAARNALNAWCYWTLRGEGIAADAATSRLEGMSVAAKNELLFQRGINFNDLPLWQRRGFGVLWVQHQRQAINPKSGEPVTATRRRLEANFELPMREDFSAFIRQLLSPPPQA